MFVRATLPALLALSIAVPPAFATSASPILGEDAAPPAERTVRVRSVIHVTEIPAGTDHLDLWVPIPRVSPCQEVRDLKIHSPFPPQFNQDSHFGNRMAWFGIDHPPAALEIALEYTVRRIENVFGERGPEAPIDPEWALYPSTLIPITSQGREIALEQVDITAPVIEKARALYDHTNATMAYDKSGDGWGQGDFQYACDAHRGNCTDYHSYFIGLCRNIGIPAYFEIGYGVPGDKIEGKIPGYHCWAYFLDGERWVPVDISEGDKHPEEKEYFFGHLDPNRIALSHGRDIVLSPPQKGAPLNYFVYPYAEADGHVHAAVRIDLEFTEIAGL